ncbi:MAG: glycosyltransferase family 2 protein [Endomicrobium sp.]|nr:glycosyltransferase family 2 protein [Endomicrobium sp.]
MDISVILTVHKEGELAQKALISVFRAIKFARITLKVELLIILDKTDNETRRYVYSYQKELFCRIYEVDFGNPGLSRNFGVSKANGRYIAVFDADDLMSESWLSRAYKSLESFNKPAVAHVDKCFVFGEEEIFYKQCSSLDKDFDIAKFFLNNYWNVVCMATKTVFEKYKYQTSRIKEFCFHEDWDFYMETLANGIEHIVAAGSSVFIRRRLTSKSQTKKKYMVRSSKLFSKDSVKAYNNSSNLENFEVKSILVDIRAFLRYPGLYIQNRAKAIERLRRYVINELNTKYVRQYIDSNLVKEFVEINKIEPSFPVSSFKHKKKAFVLGTSSDIRPFLCYKELITQYDTDTECLLLLSRFNKGEEECIRNLSKDGRKYSVFLTRENESEDNHLFASIKNVRFIFLNRILRDLSLSDRENVLIRSLEQIKPPAVISVGNNSQEVNCLTRDFFKPVA